VKSTKHQRTNENSELGCMRHTEKVVQIACGSLHTILRTSENRLFGAGDNFQGALGIGPSLKDSRICSFVPITAVEQFIGSKEAVSSVHCGLMHSACVVSGKVYVWGTWSRLKEQPGLEKPIEIELKESIKDVQLGDCVTAMLTTKGSVYSFGDNKYGVLGTGDQNQESTEAKPVKVAIPEEISQISLTGQHCLALSISRSVFAWGRNSHGQLGLVLPPETGSETIQPEFVSTPILLKALQDSSPLKVAAGGCYSLFIVHKPPIWTGIEEPKSNDQEEMALLKNEVETLKATLKLVTAENKRLKIQEEKAKKKLKSSEILGLSQKQGDDSKDKEVATYRKKSAPGRTVSPFFELEFKEISLEKQISEGGYGLIYRGRWRGSVVAIKVLKTDMMKEENIKDFLSNKTEGFCNVGLCFG
jgi:Regulator of chromosome condensation (RCC1) repeat